MEVEYGLTLEDIEAFARFQLKHGPKLKPRLFVRLIGYALGLVMGGLTVLAIEFSSQPDAQWMSGFCGGFVVGLLMTWFLLALVGKRLAVQNTSRVYNTKESRWYFAWRRLKITSDGFEITNEFQQLRLSWSAVYLIDSSDDFVFFYPTLNEAHIVPRRAFRDRQHLEEFFDLACRYRRDFAERESRSIAILDALPSEQTGITLRPQP
jgi:hypothetical protein